MRRCLLLVFAAACASSHSGTPAAPTAPAPGPSVNPTAAASTTPPSAPEPDPTPPTLRLPDTARPVRYRPTLTLVPDRDDFDGTIEIDVEAREPLRVLWLNADELTVRKAEALVDGKPVAGHVYPQPKDFVGIGFDPPLPAGPSTVRLEYAGRISRRDTGGIIKTQEAGNWYITSHFEPIDARRAYPCFDEPSYKVPWELAIRVKKEHTAFSNAPIAKREDGADGMTTVRFAPTKPLPSYLTAFTAGPFERLENAFAGQKAIPMGLLVPRGMDKQWAWYSAHDSPQILPRLEEYFGSPYPFEKLDMVSVPLGRGAMENPGLVTFASTILLIPRGEETVAFKRAATSVTTHEFAHLWFGDLVTTAWWDDIWLNEAFATWMTTKVIEPWRREWNMDEQRVSVRNVAMAADALVTARRIREPIKSNDDMVNAFDAITYQKGASVIAMFERLVTPEKFQAGVRKYMKDHAYANATAKDFLSAISAEAGTDIEPAFSTFLDQSGVPLVTMQASCGGSPKVLLSQERYFPLGAEPSPEQRSQVWQIPVCIRAGKERSCTVLTAQKGEIPISKAACAAGVVPNDGASGYYHASWDPKLLENGGKNLTPVERMAALDDLGALARAGRMEYATILRLAPRFAQDPDRGVTKAVIDLVGSLREAGLVPEGQRAAYARYVRELFGRRASAIGWKGDVLEPEETKALRPELLTVMGDAGEDPQILSMARSQAESWLQKHRSIDSDVAPAALHLAAIRGDQAFFDSLHAAARAEKDRRTRQAILAAMGSFRDPAIVKQAFAIAVGDEFPIRESIPLVMGATKSSVTRDLAYEFVRSNFDALAARLPRREGGSSLIGAASVLCDDGKRNEIESFFKDRLQKTLGGPRRYAQAMETLKSCSAFRSAQATSVAAFLSGRKERISAGSGGSR
ncbi:MAG: M1 family metallopeptidase [Myxococcales bacterium]